MEIDRGFKIRADSEAFFGKYQSGYSDMEETITGVRIEFLEKQCVKELEILHNVDIQTDAVNLVCSIVGRYYDAIMFKRGNAYSSTPDVEMLKEQALWLLEKACWELKHDRHAELKRFHMEGYLMFRNLVELSEFSKEKPKPEGRNYFSHLEKENETLRHSWNEVLENCKSVLVWQKNPHRMAQLVKIRECVCQILNSEISGDEIFPKLQDIHALLNEYRRSIPAIIMQYRTVSPCLVAKVASPLTGVPTSWILNSFRPPVACLGDRLSRKVVGQDHAIQRIANIMSRPWSSGNGPSPLASFLFLPFSWIRIEEFFESLAEELYDSKDRLICFNLDVHSWVSSSSDVEIRDKWNEIQEKITEVVKSTPFCALLFQNVGACEYTTAFLENILKHGTLVDNQGKTFDLSNTLIIITSMFYVGAKERQALNCNCKYLEMDCPMALDARRTMSSKDLECERILLHKKVLGSLWNIHELVDDVLVLNGLRPLDREVITRVQLRNKFDASRQKKQLILYPSEAVVQFIFSSFGDLLPKYGLESVLKKEIFPTILHDIKRMQPHHMTTIHMDVLVASKELCYRSLDVDSALEAFKDSLSQWKTFYLKVKQSSLKVVELITKCSQLLSPMQNANEGDQVIIWLKDMKNVVDGIISNPVDSSKFLSEQHLVPPKTETRFAYWLRDYSDPNVMEDLRFKLSSALGEKYQLLNFIANAICSDGLDESLCCHPKSFLFLGLTDNSKVDLVKALSHLFESDSASELVIQISMEEYMEYGSLMPFIDHVAKLPPDGSFATGTRLSDCTQTSPCRVLVIDRVGRAHLSVFSGLLSLLDHGALRNREGKLVDFCRTVVIITSDIGNKEILAGLGGHAMGSIIEKENADQRTEEPFRFELLNRIDEIVMFDPLLEPQLENFYRLPIKGEQVLQRKLNLFTLLNFLSLNLDATPADKKKMCFALAVNYLAQEITRSRSTTAVYKRKFSAR